MALEAITLISAAPAAGAKALARAAATPQSAIFKGVLK